MPSSSAARSMSGIVVTLAALRGHNVLLFDFVLKRTLASKGAGFPPPVFETPTLLHQ
jgi:hypothetical protein